MKKQIPIIRKPELLSRIEHLSRKVVDECFDPAYFRQTYDRSITVGTHKYAIKVDHVATPIEFYDNTVSVPRCFWAVRVADGKYYASYDDMKIVEQHKSFADAKNAADRIYDKLLYALQIKTPDDEIFLRPRHQLPCQRVVTYSLR